MFRVKFFIFLAIVALLSACSQKTAMLEPLSAPDKHQVTEFTLENGMKVIVKEDHRAPVGIIQVWYRVGASDEHNGITGISHMLEHMMFKGTEKYPKDSLVRAIKREGGSYNAFTGPDYTAYYEVFEKSRLELGFDIESDRMLNLILDEQDFVKEREVVKEERRLRTDDEPRAQVWEQLYATAFHNAPYGRPVIGWMDDISNFSLDDLAQWYRKWYNPTNAFMVVAGDVDPEEVRRLAMQYMAPLPEGTVLPRKPRREAPQKGERRITVSAPAEKPFLAMGYRVPNFFNAEDVAEAYALQLLSAVLSGSSSARFAKNLTRGQRLALGVNSGYDLYSPYDDLFIITGTPLDKVSIAELEQAIEKEISKLQDTLVSEEELNRIKVIQKAGKVFSRDSISRQAYQLGRLEAVGAGWRRLYDTTDALARVTPEQIRAAARKYLIPSQRTVAILDPEPIQHADAQTP